MSDAFDQILNDVIGKGASELVDELNGRGRLHPGQTIGHYRVIELIGEGGMGAVYKAEDEKLGRFVALKRLQSSLDGDHQGRDRLAREARTASALSHPSICTIHDIVDDDSHCVIVMEFLDGETLTARMARGPIPEAEAIDIALAVASALAAAHSRTIVHCDVKPANIFLTSGGHIKVVDFGIATFQRDAGTQVRQSVQDSQALGTRAYMSPEQARGDELDQRTDIYSLGAVLRLMTPSPGPALARVIASMMREDRQERPQSMGEVAALLTRARSRSTSLGRRLVYAAAILVVVAAGAVAWRTATRKPPLAARDAILIGDFVNRTTEPIFNDILRDAVTVQVEQSPYLNVFPAVRIDDQLKLMRRPADQKLTPDVAREICERAGLKAYIGGEIAPVGSHYILRLDALNARTGDYLAHQQIDVDGQGKVLGAIGQAAAAMRQSLGESYASIKRFDVPVETATTSSLDALRAFSQGKATMRRGTSAALKAAPYFKRAIELDPDFALAYAELAVAYGNARERKLAADASRQAFLRKDRVSERERYAIAAQYYGEVTGEPSKAVEALEMWADTYPQDPIPHNRLMAVDKALGRLEGAAEHGEQAVQLEPTSALYRSNLAGAYLRLTQFDKAVDVCARAIRDKLDNSTIHRFLYTIAWIRDDRASLEREAAWRATGTSDYADLELKASLAGAEGKYREALDLYTQAIQLAERQGLDDRPALYRVRLALLETYLGHRQKAAAEAAAILSGEPSRTIAADAVFILAATGDKGAVGAADRLGEAFPSDEYVHRLWIPLTRALSHLQAGRAAAAADEIRLLDAYDRGDEATMRPSYYMGAAALAQHAGPEARRVFTRIIANRGVVATTPLFALAHLGLARASALDGRTGDARLAYEKFFDIWKGADRDLPIMKEARAEYEGVTTAIPGSARR